VRSRTTYLLCLDECGTHDMEHVDPTFPVFVLIGVLIGQSYYTRTLVPRVRAFKQRHCPNPNAVLHSRDIRRRTGDFAFLGESDDKRQRFYEGISELFAGLRIRLFASVIDKRRLRKRFIAPVNPYEVSISQLLSLVCGPPGLPGPSRPKLAAVFAEARGKSHDELLQAEYARFHSAGLWNYGELRVQNRRARTVRRLFPDRIQFRGKSDGESGLELADLAAYPIARAIVNGHWNRPDARVIGAKLEAMAPFPVCDEEIVFPWDATVNEPGS
jgi:hypothetical protein